MCLLCHGTRRIPAVVTDWADDGTSWPTEGEVDCPPCTLVSWDGPPHLAPST